MGDGGWGFGMLTAKLLTQTSIYHLPSNISIITYQNPRIRPYFLKKLVFFLLDSGLTLNLAPELTLSNFSEGRT
jgi:hypothetical protein